MRIKGIIFDLDQTIVNTQLVLQYRESRQWAKAINNLYQTSVYPGIIELFTNLKEIDFQYGIVTSSPRKYAEAVVNYHNLDISVIVAYQDTGRHKPSPDPIRKAVYEMGFQPKEVLSVGDLEIDAISGNLAGVLTGHCSWSGVIEDKADISFNNPDEIFNFVSKNDYSQHGVNI